MKNIRNEIVPMVEENEGNINKTWDLYSKLLKDRIVMLNNEVNNVTSSLICAELLYLNSQDNKSPIEFYINSPGGSVTDGIAIYETMRRIQAPVYTICLGSAASMAAFLITCGVSKSGSPAEKDKISLPCAFNSRANVLIAMVMDSDKLTTRFAYVACIITPYCL